MKLNLILAFLVWGLALDLVAERMPYDRYRSIVDRQMFGPLPPGFDPTKNPADVKKMGSKEAEKLSKEQEQVKKAIRFSVINQTPEGETAVGFTDSQDPKKPHHYYLKVGEMRDGWVVKEADITARTMTIAKDQIEVTLTLGGDSAKDANAVKSTAAAQAASSNGALNGANVIGSLRSRRLLRKQEERKQQEEFARQKEEFARQRAEAQEKAEAEKAEREAEREEQRKQMQQIMETLKRDREQKKDATETPPES